MAIDIGTLVANGLKGSSAPATSSGGWSDILPLLVNAGGSLAGGYLSGKAGTDVANADRDAAEANAALAREVYYDTRSLSRPGYMTGGAATNVLASQFGITPQDYVSAFSGGGAGAGFASDGSPLLPNYGAGQAVKGHSGGGGANALASGLGAAAGTYFGGPVGGAIGGALGGLFRKGGDNWTTLATQAPGGYDYDAYFAADPGLASEWNKADVRSLFDGNRDAYLWWHSQGMGGAGAKRDIAKLATPETPAAGAGTSTNALANPMAGFMASPYGQIATSGFRGVDVPEVDGIYATRGKVLSGAKDIALDERGKARLGGAYTDYTNGLRSLAGLNQTASSQMGGAAGTYGVNAANANTAAGTAKGNALASGYQGMAQGINGALGALSEYGKKQWGWA